MIEYRAFFVTYEGITGEINTPVGIRPINTTDPALCGVTVNVEALWDTGATATCIKPSLWERLKLCPFEPGRTKFAGIGGSVIADVALVDLFLTSNLEIELCPIYVMDFPGDADILIGMDIIGMGDFVICNTDDKTSFSFAIPSFPDRINLADKAEITNRQK